MPDNAIDMIMQEAEEKVLPVIYKYYTPGTQLCDLLLLHSRLVARKALERAMDRAPQADMRFIAEGALLHDIGIVRCDAPAIHCHGTEPYLRHGVEGRAMLETEGLPRHALVCERHTGSGISLHEIEVAHMPLPHRSMLPVSTEEKIICYADKFYSKSGNPCAEKPIERIRASVARFGSGSIERFAALHKAFGPRQEKEENPA